VPKSDHFEPEDTLVSILTLVQNQCRQSCCHIEDHRALSIVLEYLHEGYDPSRILLERSDELQDYINGHEHIHHDFVAHAWI